MNDKVIKDRLNSITTISEADVEEMKIIAEVDRSYQRKEELLGLYQDTTDPEEVLSILDELKEVTDFISENK